MLGICNQLSIHFMKLLFMGSLFVVVASSVCDQSVMIEYNQKTLMPACVLKWIKVLFMIQTHLI